MQNNPKKNAKCFLKIAELSKAQNCKIKNKNKKKKPLV